MVYDTKLDRYVYVTHPDMKHNFAYDIARIARCRLASNSKHGADAIAPFDWEEGCSVQVQPGTSIENADHQS